MSLKTWFITGTSRGFGREWAIAALDRGDKVAATARDTSSLDDLVAKYGDALLPIQLDVTDREADFAAVRQAHEHFGRLDVAINNAGYGHFGMVEELSEQDIRAQLETNLYDTDWAGSSAKHSAELPGYDTVREQAMKARGQRVSTPGDPAATREAILKIVDAERPPLRVFLGEAPLGIATADYESRLATWREWQPVSVAAQGNG